MLYLYAYLPKYSTLLKPFTKIRKLHISSELFNIIADFFLSLKRLPVEAKVNGGGNGVLDHYYQIYMYARDDKLSQ